MVAKNEIVGMLFLLVVGFCLIPAAMADNSTGTNDTSDNLTDDNSQIENLTEEDEQELGAIENYFGAEVRLLQLERRITRNILVGSKIVEVISEKNSSTDVSELEAILDEMEDLVEEVRDTPREGNRSELAQTFVDLKKRAIELTQEFKDIAKDYLEPSDRDEVRGAMSEIDRELLKNINSAIVQARREFNANVIETILAGMNVTNAELTEKIRNGEATMAEVRNEIRSAFGNLSAEHKKVVAEKTRERVIKRNIARNVIKESVRENFMQKQIIRHEEIAEKLRNRLEAVRQNLTIKTFDDRINHLQIREHTTEQIQERLEAIKNNVKARGK